MVRLVHHAPDVAPDVALRQRDDLPPPAALGWYRRLRLVWQCLRTRGHCWHPADAMIAWACCECPAETDGMPPDRCADCARRRG